MKAIAAGLAGLLMLTQANTAQADWMGIETVQTVAMTPPAVPATNESTIDPVRVGSPLVWMQKNLTLIVINLDNNGEIGVLAFPYPIGGRLAVCGATWRGDKRGNIEPYISQMLGTVAFYLDGKQVRGPDARNFVKYDSMDEMTNAMKASCTVTAQPWVPGTEKKVLELKLRTTRIRE